MNEKLANTVDFDENGLAKFSGIVSVYNFSSLTGEFTGTCEEYLMAGISIPENSTILPPPETKKNTLSIFQDGAWHTIKDHRGETIYSTIDGGAINITQPGDYPSETTSLKPSTNFDKWNGMAWITDANAQKAASIKEAELKKEVLIKEANEKTQAWQTQLLLGIISDEDKDSLITWMKYVQAVQAVDPQTAPSITWPVKPV
ncbi:tail fiber assembly protein [Erwinia sp. ErVv1]|uniref:tail fiber assembly protein n=1 Tax=Erwinia sp. ErVv1 TaxID=1603299 RepID=UPI0008352CBB|nr:tail fiber assembly protein [Erwinia sp. ErVv1]